MNHAVEDACQVDVEHALPELQSLVFGERGGGKDPGVVEGNVELAITRECRLDQCGTALVVAHVQHLKKSLRAVLLNQLHHLATR
ncbi:hypothetical protein D3C80_1344030 [compost metagenome]